MTGWVQEIIVKMMKRKKNCIWKDLFEGKQGETSLSKSESKWPQNVNLPPPNPGSPGVFFSFPTETALSGCQAPD